MASAASAMDSDGSIGVDHVWQRRLQRALDETKCPASLDDALRPLMAHFPEEIDAGDLQAAVDGQRELWRVRLYSATGGFQLPPSYRLDWAVAIYVYTLSAPKVFRVVNREMFNPERRKNGGVSAGLRACLPYICFLTAALKALPARYVFRGQVRRGVKHVFPTIADHDPARHFAIGAFVMWYEFKSTSRNPQVMAREHFCGVAAGPRTTFIVDVVCGYDISQFSFFQGAESEYEVLMLPMSLFEVVYVAKNILDATETVILERSGFPDVVHLRQVVASAAGVPLPAPAAAASADGVGEHASGEELLEAVRARLRKHAVKLWLPPYCVDGNPQPGAVVALLPTFFAERHDSPALLAASEEALVQSLTHLQAHSLKKLQARGVGQAPKAQSTSPEASPAAASSAGFALYRRSKWRNALKHEASEARKAQERGDAELAQRLQMLELPREDARAAAGPGGAGGQATSTQDAQRLGLDRERLATGHFEKREYAQALPLYEQARASFEAAGDRAGVGKACNGIAACYYNMGQPARALPLHEQARAIAEAAGDRAGVGRACHGIAVCYGNMGQHAQALPLHEQARASFEAAGDCAGVGRACVGISACYADMGQPARAIPLHEQARAIAEAAGDRAGVGRACGGIAACYADMGQPARALPLHEQARAIAEAAGDRAGVGRACQNIAACYLSMGQPAQALPLLEQARAILEAAGDRAGVGTACLNIAACYHSMGQPARALPLYEQARAILEAAGDRANADHARQNIAACFASMGLYAACFASMGL